MLLFQNRRSIDGKERANEQTNRMHDRIRNTEWTSANASMLQSKDSQLTLDSSHAVKLLFGAVIFQAGMHLFAQLLRFGLNRPTPKGFAPLFDLNTEANIPTFFSSLLLLSAALLAWIIHRFEHRKTKIWGLFSAVLLMMSVDEIRGAQSFSDRLCER